MFTLAHLSDLHLGPLPVGSARRDFALKRTIGVLNWRMKRHKLHSTDIVNAIAGDIVAAAPDHVALTGDIVNVAARDEFTAAASWLKGFGQPGWISFVPGNHDTYVRMDWQHGLAHLADYMQGDMRIALTQSTPQIAAPFPYVRLRRNVALIGVSSAVPQPLHRASGLLGPTQLDSLATLLSDLRERGYARVLMLHHPPLPGLAKPRKALADADRLRNILMEQGAELVLHGHNHVPMVNTFASRFGNVNVLGVPSASHVAGGGRASAAWNHYRIQRMGGKWAIIVRVRSFDPASGQVVTLNQFSLSS